MHERSVISIPQDGLGGPRRPCDKIAPEYTLAHSKDIATDNHPLSTIVIADLDTPQGFTLVREATLSLVRFLGLH